MPQHDSKYFALNLEEILAQSSLRILAWTIRWKIGRYQSIRQEKQISKQMIVPFYKVWDSDRLNKPEKKVDS